MDVDTPSNPTAATAGGGGGGEGATSEQVRSIKLHPLAIIGISDHHTRVVTGGSALPPSAPVVGLLFGHYSSGSGSGRDVSIVDAEEMEYPKISAEGGGDQSHRDAILQKIELHQKVFPQHKVVGWYRVQKQDDNSMNVDGGAVMPSEDDLRMNQTEMASYCRETTKDKDGKVVNVVENSPLFVLMNASKTDGSGSSEKKQSSSVSNASEEMEVDEELPLTVYETLTTPETAGSGGAVFVNADFELETYEPERIAVEKVFKTQPSKSAAAAAAKKDATTTKEEGCGDSNRKTGKKSKKDEDKSQQQQQQQQQQNKPTKPAFTRGPTELDSQLDSLQSSIRAMNVRMNVLLEFLKKVESGEIPADATLLRSVDGLVRQLPLVLAALEEGGGQAVASPNSRKPLRELENEYSNTMLLSYLAAVAKTAKSVHVYSEKFRNVSESGKSDPRRQVF